MSWDKAYRIAFKVGVLLELLRHPVKSWRSMREATMSASDRLDRIRAIGRPK